MTQRGLGRKGRNTEDEQGVVRDYLQQFSALGILQGCIVDAVIPAGTLFVIAPHGLGRVWKYAALVGASYPISPTAIKASVVPTIDPATNILFQMASTVGVDAAVSFWVW